MKPSGAAVLAVLSNSKLVVSTYSSSYPATTNSSITATATATATGACWSVSASWASQIAATATPTVAASLAYDCLNSVAINKEAALKFVNELEPRIRLQITSTRHDLFAELADVKAGIEADKYQNEYAWQLDLYKRVFGPAHDGHLVVYPDLLAAAIEFGRQVALVSISEDGSSLPVIKLYEDVISSPDTASVVKLINGIDAATYIADWIYQAAGNQDADAAYNSMFFEKAYVAELNSKGYFQSGGRTRYIYPGDTTSFEFENGTTLELTNVARVKGNWTGVTDGPSFFKTFCPGALESAGTAGPTSTSSATSTSSSTATATTTTATPTGVPGYPAPVIISSDSTVSGYFLDEPGFEDVAVLAMLSFSPEDPPEFQRVVQDFFVASVKAGKTKLVVDVQVNGGGYIFQGYDTFRQIFPDIVQQDENLIYECESVFNWRYDLDIALNSFTSYEDKFGPEEFNDDEYTDLIQWNFNNEIDTINSTFGIGYDITGYGSRKNFTRPFGGPENVVVVFDGYCASTCTLFAQFMKDDAGVKQIAMGGRPKIGAIQGVGGVKGSQSYDFGNVYAQAQLALQSTNDTSIIKELSRYTTYVSDRAVAASLNVKDEIDRDSIDDGTPAQFVAEYSECRLYWTEDMVKDVSDVWKSAASAAFKGGDCSYGSIDYSPGSYGIRQRRVPPRFAMPKGRIPVEKTIAKRDVSEKAKAMFLSSQHMMVID